MWFSKIFPPTASSFVRTRGSIFHSRWLMRVRKFNTCTNWLFAHETGSLLKPLECPVSDSSFHARVGAIAHTVCKFGVPSVASWCLKTKIEVPLFQWIHCTLQSFRELAKYRDWRHEYHYWPPKCSNRLKHTDSYALADFYGTGTAHQVHAGVYHVLYHSCLNFEISLITFPHQAGKKTGAQNRGQKNTAQAASPWQVQRWNSILWISGKGSFWGRDYRKLSWPRNRLDFTSRCSFVHGFDCSAQKRPKTPKYGHAWNFGRRH